MLYRLSGWIQGSTGGRGEVSVQWLDGQMVEWVHGEACVDEQARWRCRCLKKEPLRHRHTQTFGGIEKQSDISSIVVYSGNLSSLKC